MSRDGPAFAAFYHAVHQRDPFPWQERLAEQLATKGWPDVLDLPTGTGKTSAIDIAIWHLATAEPGTAARRILYVVDRRLVVDQTHEHAQRIAEKLAKAGSSRSALGAVASRLRRLAGVPGAPPLEVARLRGGMPREPEWVRTPLQPVVLVSTVDQVGSRLLFRGYGVSDSMLPVHAGLMGEDALILVDEAHLSEPFRQTLEGLANLRTERQRERQVSTAPWHFVVLSATPGAAARRVFRLQQTEWRTGVLRQRLCASKPAELREVADDPEQLAAELAQGAMDLLHGGERGPRSVLVVANRVAIARRVFEMLQTRLDAAADVELLIGPSRPLDRLQRLGHWLERLRAGRDTALEPTASDDRPLILVATQCIEVGVDIDADALVTESAPLDALRQRFGRLDRLGNLPPATGPRAVIVHRRQRSPDAIYGGAINETVQWLRTRIPKRRGALQAVDFGLSAMDEALARVGEAERAAMLSPRNDAPILLPQHLDAWIETWPAAQAPEPAMFLHGPLTTPDVTVVWRDDLHLDGIDDAETSAPGEWPSLDALPPSVLEAIQVPVRAVRRWLMGVASADIDDVSDLEGIPPVRDESPSSTPESRSRVVLRRTVEGWERIRGQQVRPGDVLVVPSVYGGCDAHGWNPAAREPAPDIAEPAQWEQRGRWIRRIRPAGGHDMLADTITALADQPSELVSALMSWLEREGRLGDGQPPEKKLELVWYDRRRPELGVILLGPVARGEGAATTEDDDGSFSDSSRDLLSHLGDVAAWVERFAEGLRLGASERKALSLAARWHDIGKVERRFQAALRGVPRVSRFDRRPPLAKSVARAGSPQAFRLAGLPRGWRHEALSVALATPHLVGEGAEERELALWLIGTHHGRGRPFFAHLAAEDIETVPVTLDDHEVDAPAFFSPAGVLSDHTERFSRLLDRYGPHRLAWLEAILRLADHRASEAGASPGAYE